MIRCVIVDDEPLARDVIEEHLSRQPDVLIAGKFGNAFEALLFLDRQEIDLLFLDIEMPEITGISLLKKLEQAPLTIFITAYRDYAFEGFELGVIDFLLKPVSGQRFDAALEKVRDFLRLKAQDTRLEPADPTPEYLFVKSGTTRIKLFFNEVLYIQGLKDYAIIHTAARRIVIKGSVKLVHDLFPASSFIRVHRSFIVAKEKIVRIERSKLVIGDQAVPIGRNYREKVEAEISRPR